MNIYRFIILAAIAIAFTACQPKTASRSETASSSAESLKQKRRKPDSIGANEMAGDKPARLARLIVPGKQIGQISIGESGEEVNKKLGTPDGGDAAMGKSFSFWYANHDTTGYVTQIYLSRGQGNDEVKRIKQIRVTSPFFKLSSKIHVGSSLMSVSSTFNLKKAAAFTEKGVKRILYDDSKAGIAFDVDERDQISGITVHERGRGASTTYLDFFSGLKVIE